MQTEASQKITANHLKRGAYLYIRQSTIRQVLENTESTKRQYALRERAVALGWPMESITVIDSDLGKSGAESDREGFQRLVADVGIGRVGIVLGLEVSRLARNSMDWHRLLEICALSKTLILDEDGIYDPSYFNDRLLLGLKGTMSEAELHIIRARLQGGIENKARRGELKMRLPIGFTYDHNDIVRLDPDMQVQESINLLFTTYKRTASACATVKYFRENHLSFPRRLYTGVHKGELLWSALEHHRILQVLHNPRYAGAFVYGKTRTQKNIDGNCNTRKLLRNEWQTIIQNAHIGYIDWEGYEANLKQLKQNSQAYGHDRRKSPPREGPALLQGIVLCGYCGKRMTQRYCSSQGALVPRYMCQREGIEHSDRNCQEITGAEIDKVIGKILIENVNSMNIEIALAVEQQMQSTLEKSNLLRKQQVERAKYEADLARRRFINVDPENRLVANTLEAEWNEKLRYYNAALEEYEEQIKTNYHKINEEKKECIRALVNDFALVWNNPNTPDRERKRLVRLIIEDVTLRKENKINVHIRFKGGTTKSIVLDLPKKSWQEWTTDKDTITKIDQLLDYNLDSEVAQQLNNAGKYSGKKQLFTSRIIARLRKQYGLKSSYDRLRKQGFLDEKEMASLLNVAPSTIKIWHLKGYLRSRPYNAKGSCLYKYPDNNPPIKGKWKNNKIKLKTKLVSNQPMEVQYAT